LILWLMNTFSAAP